MLVLFQWAICAYYMIKLPGCDSEIVCKLVGRSRVPEFTTLLYNHESQLAS